MIGGTVTKIELAPLYDADDPSRMIVEKAVRVTVLDSNGDVGRIIVDADCPVDVDDYLWWQGALAFWTPASCVNRDLPYVRADRGWDAVTGEATPWRKREVLRAAERRRVLIERVRAGKNPWEDIDGSDDDGDG